VHAVAGYWVTAPTQPATVVMPTATGKTDTMNAIFAAKRLARLLVIVPTDALRTQLGHRLETYGVLPELGVLEEPALRPVVGTIEHGFSSAQAAIDFAGRCNIIVSTVSALMASAEPIRRALVDECSHLFIDEAHHVAATQWDQIRSYFDDRHVVQFTATPFRADGKHLGGRLIFAFPLREAQRQGYFSKIDYIPVTDYTDPDRAIAVTAIGRLRQDLDNGYDHLLMARVKTKVRADDLLSLYQELAPELAPVKIHSGETKKQRTAALRAVHNRDSKIIICVDMLGEGYDLPALKIAAIHDAHKTLPITLQFIGRFARPGAHNLATACAVVNRPDPEYDPSLRQLYADDADWNHVIRELAQTAVGLQQEISEFEAGFGSSLPEEIPLRALEPKLSTVVYQTRCTDWTPEAAEDVFGKERMLTHPIALNRQRNLAWFVIRNHTEVKWGNLKTVEDIHHDLYIMYWDRDRNLLYLNSSNTDSVHKELAKAVSGSDTEIIQGEAVYRVMAHVNRLVPTNVGLIDVRSRARRFSMHVGADVTEGFPTAEAQTKSKTNIFARGYEQGTHVGFGASLKGRIWSAKTVGSLHEWVQWCDQVGTKLTDDTISIDEVMKGFIRPQLVRERPPLAILAVDWPLNVYLNTSDETMLTYDGKTYPLLDTELQVTDHNTTGPILFEATTPHWRAPFKATFHPEGLEIQALSGDVAVIAPRSQTTLTDLFDDRGVKFYFEDETTIEHGGFLLRPPRNTPPFSPAKLQILNWTGTDIKKESQGPDRQPDSIQYKIIEMVRVEREWDIIIDDDGAGEAADIVALAILDDNTLLIRLVHCKYSSEAKPGARVADLYELCGQAHKSVHWKRGKELIDHLTRRERHRRSEHNRTGFELGSDTTLRALQHRARYLRPRLEIAIVQPGLSAAKVSQQQLQLLACAEVYVYETAQATFDVFCSA
jgi:superfamily II DNA or RNA helicase